MIVVIYKLVCLLSNKYRYIPEVDKVDTAIIYMHFTRTYTND